LLKTYLIPLRYYIKILAPDIFGNPATYNHWGQGFYHESILYVGSISLALAVFALVKLFKNKIVRFYFLLCLISFFFGVKTVFTEWFYRLPIPPINTFLPSRVFS